MVYGMKIGFIFRFLKNGYFNMNKEVLMNERGNYFRIARDQWQDFYTPGNTPLTQAELDNIKSLNDQISMKDVADVYVPLCHLIHLYMKDLGYRF